VTPFITIPIRRSLTVPRASLTNPWKGLSKACSATIGEPNPAVNPKPESDIPDPRRVAAVQTNG